MGTETVSWAACLGCGGQVAVKVNRSGRAYYRCDHCGVKHEHTWQKSSDAFLAAIGAPKPAPTPAPAPGPAPAPAPAPKPAKAPATFFG